jgi:hypothetical protein
MSYSMLRAVTLSGWLLAGWPHSGWPHPGWPLPLLEAPLLSWPLHLQISDQLHSQLPEVPHREVWLHDYSEKDLLGCLDDLSPSTLCDYKRCPLSVEKTLFFQLLWSQHLLATPSLEIYLPRVCCRIQREFHLLSPVDCSRFVCPCFTLSYGKQL